MEHTPVVAVAAPLSPPISRDPVLDAKLTHVTSSLDDIKRKLDSPKQENWLRDYAPVPISFFSVMVAMAAMYFNRLHNDRTLKLTQQNHERSLLEKAREEERKSIREKLDQFYGPLIQLRGVSESLYDILNARRQGPADADFRNRDGRFRTLFALLNGAKFSELDKTLLDEIVNIGETSGKLIAEKVGLVDDPELQGLLWRLAAHYRIFALAVNGKLPSGGKEFDAMSFPYQINDVLQNKANELNDRLNLLQKTSLESTQGSSKVV